MSGGPYNRKGLSDGPISWGLLSGILRYFFCNSFVYSVSWTQKKVKKQSGLLLRPLTQVSETS